KSESSSASFSGSAASPRRYRTTASSWGERSVIPDPRRSTRPLFHAFVDFILQRSPDPVGADAQIPRCDSQLPGQRGPARNPVVPLLLVIADDQIQTFEGQPGEAAIQALQPLVLLVTLAIAFFPRNFA